ncbi:cysteine hydrolase family protein [Saccharopolyspora sp. NPDC002376]
MFLAEKVRPTRTALLIVDMQNDFCSPGGFIDRSTNFTPDMTTAVAQHISALRDAAEHLGILTVHVVSHFDDEYLNEPMRERLTRIGAEPYCISGTWGAEIIDDLKIRPGELQVEKHTYDGFFGTRLQSVLEEHQIRTVVATGLATDNCVAATAKGAYFRGFYVVMPTDSCAAGSEAQHEAGLRIAGHAYAELCTSDELLTTWATTHGVAGSQREVITSEGGANGAGS